MIDKQTTIEFWIIKPYVVKPRKLAVSYSPEEIRAMRFVLGNITELL